jgi:UDPglucose--hexose-1-phosphate uridylyltransferase
VPELRDDAPSGARVVLAGGRAARLPGLLARAAETDPRGSAAACPFCPGHEDSTPPEVARTGGGPPGGPGWRVRVVPNLFPIVGGADAAPGATGAHEVVVLSPAHDLGLGALDDVTAVDVVRVLRDRVRAHNDAGHPYAVPFVNHLRPAGASIEHPHAHVVALDFVPAAVVEMLARYETAGRDLTADDLDRASTDGTVVVDGDAPVWSPYAARLPFAFRITHRRPRPCFGDLSDDEIEAVARATRDALARLAAVVGNPPYNLVVNTAPAGTDGQFHWYVDVTPRLFAQAGFEQATGVFVNIVDPAEAASALRDAG